MATWVRVLASYYYGAGGGACGNLQDGHFHYAELGTAIPGGGATGYGRLADKLGKSGELPCGFGLWVRYRGKATYATKADRGYGNTALGIHDPHQRDIDLFGGVYGHSNLAEYLGMFGVDYVEVTDGRSAGSSTGGGGGPPQGPTGDLPPTDDYNWGVQLEAAAGLVGLHGSHAYNNALIVERQLASVSYITTDGAHG